MTPRRAALLIAVLALALLWLAWPGETAPSPRPQPPPDGPPAPPPPLPEEDPPGEEPAEKHAPGPPPVPEKPAKDWIQTPFDPPAGPLLVLFRSATIDGKTWGVVWLADPEAEGPPREVLRATPRWRPDRRLGRNALLVTMSGGYRLLDLRKGTYTPLLADGKVEIVCLHEGEILVRSAADGILRALPVANPAKPRVLFDRKVDRVLDVTDDHLWVRVAGEPGGIWRIGKSGHPADRIGDYPSFRGLDFGASAEVSPDGSRIAIGAATFGSTEEEAPDMLVVVDAVTGKKLLGIKEIPLGVSSVSSFFPKLRFTWLDDHTIRYSETEYESKDHWSGWFRWVDVDVRTGKRIREKRYMKMGLQHEEPPKSDDPPPEPRIRVDKGRIFLAGEKEPIGEIVGERNPNRRWRPKVISPDGRWFAWLDRDARGSVVSLLDTEARQTRELVREWFEILRWLPGE